MANIPMIGRRESRPRRGTRRSPVWLLAVALLAAACTHAVPAPASSTVSTPATAANVAPPTAAAFEPEIAAFEAADQLHPPPRGGILFVGSSSIRFWSSLAADFPGLPVFNRGFGGSTLPDVNYFAPRIVLPYRPREIVLYAGDNDIAAGRTPEQVLADYSTFVHTVRSALPATRIVFLSIKPSPSRWELANQMRAANALVSRAIAGDSLATYVDVFTPMVGANGHPRPELFRDDSLHMTAEGYALWRELVGKVIGEGRR